ncbi:J domain-containing protein [Oligoflexia bacterium]|nr:J domain-containing protein [Oligoflexia bacterium]
MDQQSGRTYYDILGVTRDASKEAIKTAYHEIARVYHPDSNFYTEIVEETLTSDQQQFFQLITDAYNTLINEVKRADYDSSLPPELKTWEDTDSRDKGRMAATEFGNTEGSQYTSATYRRMSQVFGQVDKPSMLDAYRIREVRSVADMMQRRKFRPKNMVLVMAMTIPFMLIFAVILAIMLLR